MQEDMSTRDKVLYAGAMLFFERGYTKTTIVDIAERAGVNRGSVVFAVKSKEHLLYLLVAFVLESVFSSSRAFAGDALCSQSVDAHDSRLAGYAGGAGGTGGTGGVHLAGDAGDALGQKPAGVEDQRPSGATDRQPSGTDDPLLSYAAETALQLYMAESREQVRELAVTTYNLPSTSELVYRMTAKRVQELFGAYNPTWSEKDFYEREIACGSIMRGYMARPCDQYFTMERKMRVFLETTLEIYHVPEEKLAQAAAFLQGLDLEAAAGGAMERMLDALNMQSIPGIR